MTRKIEISLPQVGTIAVSVTETDKFISATAGDLTYNGDLDLDGLTDNLTTAIQKELASQLPVRVTLGKINCTVRF